MDISDDDENNVHCQIYRSSLMNLKVEANMKEVD
jgi:hypothetical protein